MYDSRYPWGSLVWNRADLAIKTDFKPDGPRLPIEFSRVSLGGRLTLVIDEGCGSPCGTYSAISAFNKVDVVIENLRAREGMPSQRGVGFIDRVAGRQSASATERHPQVVEIVKAWAIAIGYDAVVWTALASNFHEPGEANEAFSVDAAIRYLEALDVPTLASALSYIRQAPPEVQTPVRAAVNTRWPMFEAQHR